MGVVSQSRFGVPFIVSVQGIKLPNTPMTLKCLWFTEQGDSHLSRSLVGTLSEDRILSILHICSVPVFKEGPEEEESVTIYSVTQKRVLELAHSLTVWTEEVWRKRKLVIETRLLE